jgi:two-component system, OmpR family, sensor kinase
MTQSKGVMLTCDLHGNLTQINQDSLGLGACAQPGIQFSRLAAHGNLGKALSFLEEIRQKGAAFDWEINLQLDGQIRTLHFIGLKTGNELLIAGAENDHILLTLHEEMMRMSNEQANALRVALKDQSKNEELFEEISRLNNELVNMQRELARKNAELERLNQEKNQFLGMAAHDLRNPLHNILSASEYLAHEDPGELGDEYKQFIEVIHAASQFMANLVDDLLDVAKIESGKLNLDYTPVNLPDLLQKNIRRNQSLAAQKDIRIDLQAEPLPTTLLDASKMEQILNNLIGNAIKFSPNGSKITIKLVQDLSSFVLSVQDEGPGIPAHIRENLFKTFQRGQPGTQGEKSTGLGLVIVRRIVEGHGGNIWLESVEGRGTTFFVSMPIAPNAKESEDL